MTLNQIKYWELEEAKRTNRKNEDIKDWYNKQSVANERSRISISQQEADTHLGELDVKKGQLKLNEQEIALKARQTASGEKDAETRRQQANESKRHNLTTEYYQGVQARQQTRSLDQHDRSLAQQDRALDLNAYNNVTGRINAQTNQFGATTNRLAMYEQQRHNQAVEQEIPSKIFSNYVRPASQAIPLVTTLGRTAAAAAGAGASTGLRRGLQYVNRGLGSFAALTGALTVANNQATRNAVSSIVNPHLQNY